MMFGQDGRSHPRPAPRCLMTPHEINRRTFLKQTGAVAGLAGTGLLSGSLARVGAGLAADAQGVALLHDPDDAVAAAGPAKWALSQLRESLTTRGVAARVCRQ